MALLNSSQVESFHNLIMDELRTNLANRELSMGESIRVEEELNKLPIIDCLNHYRALERNKEEIEKAISETKSRLLELDGRFYGGKLFGSFIYPTDVPRVKEKLRIMIRTTLGTWIPWNWEKINRYVHDKLSTTDVKAIKSPEEEAKVLAAKIKKTERFRQ